MTTGLPEVVMLMERVSVPETLTLFVVKPVVGTGHAVGLRVTLTVAQTENCALVVMV